LLDRGECLAIGEPKAVIGAYQKLIYSSSDQRELMRQELINYYPSDGKIASDKDCKLEKTEDEREFDESYDPSLVSKSVIEYQSLGVRLSNPRIQLQNGKIVNRLLRGRQYTIVYDCEILEDAHGLHYGLMIKTVSGIELGGASYAGDLGGMSVQAGQKFEVQAIFECRLKSGFYFANVGVVGEREGTQVFLHRLVDAVCFRVEPDDNIITGMIDFDCLFDLKLA
jgi:lipopolysaccharide transport system ATP-binding protein